MFAQAFHVHRGDLAGETRQCSVCQVAHAGLQPVLIVPLLVTFKIVAFLPALAAPEAKCGLASFSLFCRPPPVAYSIFVRHSLKSIGKFNATTIYGGVMH